MNKILILDIETTNFLQKGGKIVEIGIVELNLDNGQRRILFDQVTHEQGITQNEVESSWIIANSDLTVEQVRTSTRLDRLRDEIQAILNLYPLGCTAYNNAFDFGFFDSRGFKFPKKLGCPMLLSTPICKLPKKKGKGFKWPSVEEAYHHFMGSDDFVEKHRGADDAMHEAEIVYHLYQLGEFKL